MDKYLAGVFIVGMVTIVIVDILLFSGSLSYVNTAGVQAWGI